MKKVFACVTLIAALGLAGCAKEEYPPPVVDTHADRYTPAVKELRQVEKYSQGSYERVAAVAVSLCEKLSEFDATSGDRTSKFKDQLVSNGAKPEDAERMLRAAELSDCS